MGKQYSLDFQQRLMLAAVVAVITIALIFILGAVMYFIGMLTLGVLIYALFFLQPTAEYVKPWQSRGFLLLLALGNNIGEALLRFIATQDTFSAILLAVGLGLAYWIAKSEPVNIET